MGDLHTNETMGLNLTQEPQKKRSGIISLSHLEKGDGFETMKQEWEMLSLTGNTSVNPPPKTFHYI